MDRRTFIASSVASLVVSGCRTSMARRSRPCVFLSDVHLPGDIACDTGHGGELQSAVRSILAMDPLPRVVVTFGDLAWDCGRKADYERANALLRPLEDAGVEIVHTMGNHDRRANFFAVNPAARANSPVPGRTVSVVDLGTCDLILMDTLCQGDDPDFRGPVRGTLDDAQYDWLLAELPRRSRPFVLGGHHLAAEIDLKGGRSFQQVLDASDKIVGYVHGHDHVWKDCFLWANKTPGTLIPSRCLPSCGCWGDIGHVVVRSDVGVLELALKTHDFYYPRRGDGSCLRSWQERRDSVRNAVARFVWSENGNGK